MADIGQGGIAPLGVDVVDGGGSSIDAITLTLTVVDAFDSVVAGFPVSIGAMNHTGTGRYEYDWHVDVAQTTGDYEAIWQGTSAYSPVYGVEDWTVTVPGSVIFASSPPPPSAYLSPGRFSTMRMGSKLPTAIEMIAVLEEASAIVDAYCNVPLTPTPHSFFGGRAVDEEHQWRYPLTNFDRGERRIYPRHWPIIEPILNLDIVVASGAKAHLPSNSLVVNNFERWVEVTSLALASSSGLFGVTGWVVPIGGLSNPVALISYNYGTFLTATDRTLVLTPQAGGKTYQAPHGAWAGAPTVKAAGDGVDPSLYDYDTEEGWIIFHSAPPSGKLTVSYIHLLGREIPLATGLIAAKLLGDAALRAKGMSGLASIKAGEIELSKGRMLPTAANLDVTVPDAAMLLGGFRFWSMAG